MHILVTKCEEISFSSLGDVKSVRTYESCPNQTFFQSEDNWDKTLALFLQGL